MTSLSFDLPDDLVERIVDLAVVRLQEQHQTAGAPAAPRWLRGAKAIAAYVDAPVSRVKALSSAGRIPVEKDGSALLAHTDDLDRWIREGGGKRP